MDRVRTGADNHGFLSSLDQPEHSTCKRHGDVKRCEDQESIAGEIAAQKVEQKAAHSVKKEPCAYDLAVMDLPSILLRDHDQQQYKEKEFCECRINLHGMERSSKWCAV